MKVIANCMSFHEALQNNNKKIKLFVFDVCLIKKIQDIYQKQLPGTISHNKHVIKPSSV